MLRRVRAFANIALLLAITTYAHGQARLEVCDVPGKTLAGNPIHDPAERKIAVFLPSEYDAGKPLPTVYWLPGFGGSSEDFIRTASAFEPTLQGIADAGGPVVFVVIDGRTRWGCSQYIDSPAQGKYAQYIAREVVSYVEKRFHISRRREDRIIGGHSSGGFGALRLAIKFPKVFGRCVALSPDSDFEISHRPLALKQEVTANPLAHIEALQTDAVAGRPTFVSGETRYIVALSAAYAPLGPGRFDWLIDGAGQLRSEVWRRWMANDPLEIVRRNRSALRSCLAVYLNGGMFDSYKANIGAGKINAILTQRGVHSTFYESPGGHSSNMPDRMKRGILWVLGKSG